MFTLKFYRTPKASDGTHEDVISCAFYQVFSPNDPVQPHTITTYATSATSETSEGVDRHISQSDDDFDICYIENLAGKTIGKVVSVG